MADPHRRQPRKDRRRQAQPICGYAKGGHGCQQKEADFEVVIIGDMAVSVGMRPAFTQQVRRRQLWLSIARQIGTTAADFVLQATQ